MKIIITKSFLKEYNGYRGKRNIPLPFFCKKLYEDILSQKRYLNRPYLKIKANIEQSALRLVANYFEKEDICIPLIITDKLDKKLGFNLTRQNIYPYIPLCESKTKRDLLEKDYQVYEF